MRLSAFIQLQNTQELRNGVRMEKGRKRAGQKSKREKKKLWKRQKTRCTTTSNNVPVFEEAAHENIHNSAKTDRQKTVAKSINCCEFVSIATRFDQRASENVEDVSAGQRLAHG